MTIPENETFGELGDEAKVHTHHSSECSMPSSDLFLYAAVVWPQASAEPQSVVIVSYQVLKSVLLLTESTFTGRDSMLRSM